MLVVFEANGYYIKLLIINKMKSAILAIALLCSVSMASPSSTLFAALSSKLKVSSTAEGVFDTVTDLLNDLRSSIVSEQGEADARNVTETAECKSTIATLFDIENNAKQVYDDAAAHTQFLQNELTATNEHIDFIQARIDRNANKLEELRGQRCSEAELFVDDLMSHKEALGLIEFLRGDLKAYFQEAREGGQPSFAQVKDKVDMLQVYSSLFKGH